MFRFNGRVAVSLLTAVLPLLAPAAVEKIMSGPVMTLPGTGVRLRVFQGLQPQPLPLPPIRAVRLKDHAGLLEALYWWRYKQMAGIWRSDLGSILVGELRLRLFRNPELAAESELEEKYWDPDAEAGWGDQELLQWITTFTGEQATGFEKPERTRYYSMRKVKFATASSTRFAWLVLPDRAPGRQIFVCYEVPVPLQDERAHQTIAKSVSNIEFLPPDEVGTARRLSTGSVSEAPRNPSPEYAASRRRVIDGIRNFRSWWYFETAHYIFVSNQEDRRGILKLRRDLEQARRHFSAYFPSELVENSAGVVRIFNTRDEYVAYVGKEMEWSGGLWSPQQRELVISPFGGDLTESQQNRLMRQVTFHEGFHQYLYYATGGGHASLWFNEGAAQFFEGINLRYSRPVVSLDKTTLQRLRNVARSARNVDLEKFVKQDREAFYAGAGREFNYQFSQLLMYYLLKGAPAARQENYAAIPARYVEKLTASGDPDAATAYAFEKTDFRQLKEDLLEFWEDDRMLRRAEKYEPRDSRRRK